MRSTSARALLLALALSSNSSCAYIPFAQAIPVDFPKSNPSQYTPALLPKDLSDGIAIAADSLSSQQTKLLQQLDEQLRSGTYKDIHSLLIYSRDALVYENYFKGTDDFIEFENDMKRNRSRPVKTWTQFDQHYVASVNNGITSLLTGLALDQTKASITKPIIECLPEYQKSFDTPEKRQISIEDLLTMQSGFAWNEWGGPDLALLWHSNNFVNFLLARSNTGPGRTWTYNSAVPNVLLHCVQNLLHQPLRSWADENFFKKLGIKNYKWQNQRDAVPEASARMFLRPRDLLKIGIMIKSEGVWQNQSVIPAEWIRTLHKTKVHAATDDYSYLTWLRDVDGHRYLSFEGDGGQYLNVYPDMQLVVVLNQGNYLDYPLWRNQMDTIQKEFLFPAFTPKEKP